ncbi:uncharacterized protein PFL1_00415 [Pseudozyma flocculosa PF-1]|nr:uncharacterized protein PFL1_00415 [Pseudozyma flocculosa PF-1]EPQ32218.1 hypothetical protein PFL1_00415 [Pseudozyma flocculosa PF-1]
MGTQDDAPSVLSSDDVVELTRFAREKTNIDIQIELIERQPRIEVFEGLRDYCPDDGVLSAAEASLRERESHIDRMIGERDHMAAEVERFNVSDMNRLRKVAKASSQGHMSARDTDLIEITLDTIYSLDKLQKLLATRKASLDLARQRLAWERRLCECWTELDLIAREVEAFVQHKARWSPAEYSRRAQASASSNASEEAAQVSAPGHSAEHGRLASLASWQLTGEALELEAARANLRIATLAQEAVPQAGSLLDAIIDQCQVPEKFIDEQEKLEEALPDLVARGSFAAELTAQWERADVIYRRFKALRRQARDIDGGVVERLGEIPSPSALESLRRSMGEVLDALDGVLVYDRSNINASMVPPGGACVFPPQVAPPSPTHPAFPDQQHLNAEIQGVLQKDARSTLKKVWLANAAVTRYGNCLALFDEARLSVINLVQPVDALRHAANDAEQRCRSAIGALNAPQAPMSPEMTLMRQCQEGLDSAMASASKRRSDALFNVKRCEAAGMPDARTWLAADAALDALAGDLDAAAAARRRLAALADILSDSDGLRTAISEEEERLDHLARTLYALAAGTKDVLSFAQGPAIEQRRVADQLEAASSALAASNVNIVKLCEDDDALARRCKVAEATIDAVGGAPWRLHEKITQLKALLEEIRQSVAQVEALQRAYAHRDRLEARISEVRRLIDRQKASLLEDWTDQLGVACQAASNAVATLQSVRTDLEEFDRTCVDSARPSVSSSMVAGTFGSSGSSINDHLNSIWMQLKADMEGEAARASELSRFVDALDQHKNLHAAFDGCRDALVACIGGDSDSTHDVRPRPADIEAAKEAFDSLCAVGDQLRDAAALGAIQNAEAIHARLASQTRLSELDRLRLRFDEFVSRKDRLASSQREPPPVPPRRAQATQRALGLGFGPKHHGPAPHKDLRTNQAGGTSSADTTCLAALLLRSREGPIALQTIDDQGRLQMRQLLDLPREEDFEAGKHFWAQLCAEADELKLRTSGSSDHRMESKARHLARDVANKAQRFGDLCAFASAAAAIDRQQSHLIQMADSLSGFAVYDPTAHDHDSSIESRPDTPRSASSSGKTLCLEDRLEDGIAELGRLLERAKADSVRVRSDVRVRRRLAKLVRSNVEVTHTARAALNPDDSLGPDPSDDDDGLSTCTFSSFDRLDTLGWETASLGGFSRARSASIEGPLSRQGSPYASSVMLRGGSSSRASVRSPLGAHVVYAAANSMDRPMPQTPSRIPRTPGKTRQPSQPVQPREGAVTPASQPNRYRANPKNRLDVAVGRIVNRLPMKVKVSPVSAPGPRAERPGFKDESGQYWVGDPEPKLCFCRILRSKTVMVRVGGGWQELSQFILQHYAHLAGLTITPTSSPIAARTTPAASPWLRSASTSTPSCTRSLVLRQQQQQQQQRTGRLATPSYSGSPLTYSRQRVESMPVDGSGSPYHAARIPSLVSIGGGDERTPSKTSYNRRYASSSIATPSSVSSAATPRDDHGAIEGVIDAKLSLY